MFVWETFLGILSDQASVSVILAFSSIKLKRGWVGCQDCGRFESLHLVIRIYLSQR